MKKLIIKLLNKIIDSLKSTYGSKIINSASLINVNKHKKD